MGSYGPCVFYQVLCHMFIWSLCVLLGPLPCVHVVLVCSTRSSAQRDDKEHECNHPTHSEAYRPMHQTVHVFSRK